MRVQVRVYEYVIMAPRRGRPSRTDLQIATKNTSSYVSRVGARSSDKVKYNDAIG